MVVLLLLMLAGPATADVGLESSLTAASGVVRTSTAELHDRAHQRAQQIVNDLTHCCIGSGEAEILGGPSYQSDPVADVTQAFMASPAHAAVLRDQQYTEWGCAEFVADGAHWFVCIFAQGTARGPILVPSTPAVVVPSVPVISLPDTAT